MFNDKNYWIFTTFIIQFLFSFLRKGLQAEFRKVPCARGGGANSENFKN